MTDRNGEMAMINAISKVTLYVNNQEEAKAFWTERWDLRYALRNRWDLI